MTLVRIAEEDYIADRESLSMEDAKSEKPFGDSVINVLTYFPKVEHIKGFGDALRRSLSFEVRKTRESLADNIVRALEGNIRQVLAEDDISSAIQKNPDLERRFRPLLMILQFFEEATTDSSIVKRLEDADFPEAVNKPYTLVLGFHDIPDDIFIDMIRIHAAAFNGSTKELHQSIPAIVDGVLGRMAALRASGILPVDMDILRNRLSRVHFSIYDPLIDPWRVSEFDPQTQTVSIARDRNHAEAEHSMAHELGHVASGTAFIKRTDPLGPVTDFQRIGLLFSSRFHWLNEAVTEEIAQLIIPSGRFVSYREEMALYTLLRSSGKYPLEQRFFYNAYFENFDLAGTMRHLPAWNVLRNMIDVAYDHRFLIRLDKMVSAKGVEYTLNHFREMLD